MAGYKYYKKWIKIVLFMIFFGGVIVSLHITLSYNERHSGSEPSTGRFGWYQPKEPTKSFMARRKNDSEKLTQNSAAVKNGERIALNSNNSYMKKCTKQILYWLGPKMLLPDGEYFCPDVNCTVRFKSDESYGEIGTSDAVIIHHSGNWSIEQLKRYRPAGQMWIYMSRNPPHSGIKRVPDVFNWTMTYRPSSDFPIPYGIYKNNDFVTKKQNRMTDENRNWAENKTKLASWMASNCNGPSWPRTPFVKDLSTKMNVDMFGKCGGGRCSGSECLEQLSSYKFYLALENSRCTDYITEKMWRNAFVYGAVPIVYGTNRQNYEKLAPPNSFIHVSDFPNMTSLANYIQLLDRNDSMYNDFFRWRYFSYIDE